MRRLRVRQRGASHLQRHGRLGRARCILGVREGGRCAIAPVAQLGACKDVLGNAYVAQVWVVVNDRKMAVVVALNDCR